MLTNTNVDDFDAYLDELKRPWHTMDADMKLAYEIILQTHDEEDAVCLLDIRCSSQDEYQLEFPKWQQLVELSLIRKHGDAQGRLIFQKVVMRLFQLSKNNALSLH